ncbi:transporter substrate-binding domain-containing protein [Bacillus massiliigorillae]|uniref:transporter substrate-binding domain-containing protein n=1 Tax=Bacillus massiliigorillae TaxID=1243664 RepID=UPI00039B792D|nr:transporter substrate-binding domain-containing protein [Bacillus massiliigorillae]
MKKGLFASLILAPALLLAACSDDSGKAPDKEEKAVVYKVGTDTTFPPFNYEENGEIKGIDIDLMKAIAKNQDFKVEFKPMDFKGIIPGIQAKQLDIGMGGMSITDERKQTVDFSDPYFDAGITLAVKKENDSIKSLDDLKGKRIAVKKGTISAKYAMEVVKDKGFQIAQFDDSPSMFLDVKNGNSAALLEDYPVISYAIAQKDLGLKTVGERLTGDQYGISVLKGKNKEVLKKINDGLAELKKSGEYDKILNQYLAK